MAQIKKIQPVAFNLANSRDKWLYDKAKTISNFSGFVKEQLIEKFEAEYFDEFVADKKKGE